MTIKKNKSAWVGITEISENYLPLSKKRVRKFVSLYLDPIYIGNRMFIERSRLEKLLYESGRDRFPLDV